MKVIINLKHVHKHYLAVKKNDAGDYETIAGGLKTSIYGCIWTSKGLIYVAKMNDKGELELIW